MKSRLVYYWESEQNRFERLTQTQPSDNIFIQAMRELEGKPATLILKDGNKIPVIVVSSGYKILAVTRFPSPVKAIIPCREIVGICRE